MKPGEIYKILDHSHIRENERKFEFMKIERWDGRMWIVKFLADGLPADWTAMPTDRLQSLMSNNYIRYIDPSEKLYFAIKELEKNDFK